MIPIVIELAIIMLLFVILCAVIVRERTTAREFVPRARIDAAWHGKDRRAYTRFTRALDATYSLENKPHLGMRARTVDISEGGLRLIIDHKLTPQTVLNLVIRLPEIDTKIEAEGTVVWTLDAEGYDDPSGKRLFFAGIRFSCISSPHAKLLSEYIRRISVQS